MQFYATHILCPEHYARILWRDIGHKGLMPYITDWTATNEDGSTALDIARWPWCTALEFEKWQAGRPAVQLLAEKQAA